MSSSANSLRPAWNRGTSKGFQPPPAVASERSQSTGEREQNNNYNKFAALDPDEDALANEAAESSNSRREGLRSAKGRSSSIGANTGGSSKPSGRSLADLAARAPEGPPRRLSALRSGSEGSTGDHKEQKVVRFTRERLLSMRPKSLASPPGKLAQDLEGSVILSLDPQDPVCWDTFDAEEIWATVPPRRASMKEDPLTRRPSSALRRESSSAAGRWQRGVALPPEGSKRVSTSTKEAENPNDLWDDPVGAESGASNDFSAFGTMPMDDNEPFDFDKMAEASRKLEEEMHGRSRASSTASTQEEETAKTVTVDVNRPLAAAGTTIRSGSGDDVNVFEDFDDNIEASSGETEPAPAPTAAAADPVPIQKADADPNASSLLMAMIGVQKDESVASDPKLSDWGGEPIVPPAVKDTNALAGIPLNPWGDPISGAGVSNGPSQGLDLQAQLRREAELKQKAADAEAQRRREQEEAQRLQQQQQQQQQKAERQRQQQQQQQAGVQSQVELVLMERISTILENSWGRSDLVSILTTLHAEDSRVIPLLSNVDALRALLLRNPRRVAIRQDPALRAEMAALLITNAQWQQQQQQQQQAQQAMQQQQQQQQQELQRREQQRRMEAEQAAAQQQRRIVPDAPWYYSDPSKNIQGPFRGEEMRQWLEAGYFKGDLPISQSPNGPFRPLSAIFTDLSTAFVFKNDDTAAEDRRRAEAEEHARREAERAKAEAEAAERERLREQQEKERLAREQQERQAREEQERLERAQQQAREQEERAKAEAAAQAQKANGNNNESSNQLKLMLGLGAQAQVSEQPAPPQQQSKAEEKKSSKKKAQQQQPTQPQHAEEKSPSAPAWGGVAVSKPVSRKSMSEIQKEEARAAAVAAMKGQGSRSSSSGWANVAASRGGTTGWTGNATALQKPTAVLAAPAGRQQQRAMSLQPASNVAAANAQLAANQSNKMPRSSSVSATGAADAFGAKMSPEFERWCKDQMTRLNGTDDLTLVAFCMTLNDADEIRQYLTAYLGSTPHVNSFATEFINRKGGSQGKQDEWESTVPVKKGRKKKTGAR